MKKHFFKKIYYVSMRIVRVYGIWPQNAPCSPPTDPFYKTSILPWVSLTKKAEVSTPAGSASEGMVSTWEGHFTSVSHSSQPYFSEVPVQAGVV